MKNKMIAKPMTLMREEFLQNMVDLCNNSGLPFFVIESTMIDLLKDIHTASQKQSESDKAEYYKELAKLQSSSEKVGENDGN